jgi:hypothetical protein
MEFCGQSERDAMRPTVALILGRVEVNQHYLLWLPLKMHQGATVAVVCRHRESVGVTA